MFSIPLRELVQAYGQVSGEGKIPNLGAPAEFHSHVHEATGIRASLSKPDMEDITTVHNRKEDMFYLCTACKGDVCTRSDMGAVRIVDRKGHEYRQDGIKQLQDYP
jgi:hypothetical protein